MFNLVHIQNQKYTLWQQTLKTISGGLAKPIGNSVIFMVMNTQPTGEQHTIPI